MADSNYNRDAEKEEDDEVDEVDETGYQTVKDLSLIHI